MLNLKKLVRSFYYAGRGLAYILKTEQNFRLEFFGSIFIVFWMFHYNISWVKIAFLSFVFLLILSFEIINTVFEEITDFLITERKRRPLKNDKNSDFVQDDIIGHIKDLAAALVLFVGIVSLFIAIAIFLKI